MPDQLQETFSSWDGTRLAFRLLGSPESPRTLLFVNGLFCDDGYWRLLHRHLAPRYRIAVFDHRGHGASGLPAHEAHVEIHHLAQDAEALCQHLEWERPALLGFSLGVQVVLEYARRFPHMLRALVAITGSFENPLSTFYGAPVPERLWRTAISGLLVDGGRSVTAAWRALFYMPGLHQVSRLVGATRADASLMRAFYRHQRVVHVPTGLRMALAATSHSARDLLPHLHVPAMVVAGGRDTFTPPHLGRHMRDSIPHVVYLEVPHGTHTTLLEAPEQVNPSVAAFLDGLNYPS